MGTTARHISGRQEEVYIQSAGMSEANTRPSETKCTFWGTGNKKQAENSWRHIRDEHKRSARDCRQESHSLPAANERGRFRKHRRRLMNGSYAQKASRPATDGRQSVQGKGPAMTTRIPFVVLRAGLSNFFAVGPLSRCSFVFRPSGMDKGSVDTYVLPFGRQGL